MLGLKLNHVSKRGHWTSSYTLYQPQQEHTHMSTYTVRCIPSTYKNNKHDHMQRHASSHMRSKWNAIWQYRWLINRRTSIDPFLSNPDWYGATQTRFPYKCHSADAMEGTEEGIGNHSCSDTYAMLCGIWVIQLGSMYEILAGINLWHIPNS